MARRSDIETRERILDAALTLFRRKGFDGATMRDVARTAGLSLGAAYYYFESKEALVLAYYQRVQDQHEQLVAAALADVPRLEDRLERVFSLKLDLIAPDRRFLGALFRFLGDPDHPASVLGAQTRQVRRQSIRTFARAVEPLRLEPLLHEAVATVLLTAHLGLVLHALYDGSKNLERTRTLLRSLIPPAAASLRLLRLPGAGALLRPTIGALGRAGLLSLDGEANDDPRTRRPHP
jgi:AcrR family transcriptional regulator